MILELSVENIAVIENAQIHLGPGFTVLTGETGAGKSLLVDAIALALGGRADADLLRAGAQKGPVHLVADIQHNAAALSMCDELGIVPDDGRVFIQREISAEGRNVSRIQGKSQPVSTVKALGNLLVDLHGQHDHQALLDPERHGTYLDLWIGEPVEALKEEVRDTHQRFEVAKRELASLRAGLRDREQRLDLLRYQVNEIETVSPRIGELAELENQLNRLKHSEKIAANTFAALGQLSDEEGSAQDQVGGALTQLEQAAKFDESLQPLLDPVRAALESLNEASQALRRYTDQLENDPGVLEETAQRQDAIKRLLRKYGDTEQEVLSFLESAQRELALLADAEASEESAAAEVERARARLNDACAMLTALRNEKASSFGELVRTEIRELAMEKAEFAVGVEPKEPDASGADDIQFLFSANPGEPMRGLSKIASGGEMSRVMLSLKVVLAGKAGVPTLIFDEIDTGLSGRAAAVVARKLQDIAAFYQVVSISHLPQLAGRADVHYRIEKVERDGRTFTQIRQLGPDERVEEVARMLAGEEIGEMALANARELLARSRSAPV